MAPIVFSAVKARSLMQFSASMLAIPSASLHASPTMRFYQKSFMLTIFAP
jgi:hypothetical protein